MTAPTKDVVIGKYVELRDEMAAIGERHVAELAPIQDQMQKIEAWLLANLNQDGVDSYKTALGTAYKSVTMSAKMEDKIAFAETVYRGIAQRIRSMLPISDKEWAPEAVDLLVDIIANSDWSLADVRVNKTGVKEFMETHEGATPPGVAVENFTKVNIRRA